MMWRGSNSPPDPAFPCRGEVYAVSKRHFLFLIFGLLLISRELLGQAPPQWKLGDVFVAVGNGQYKVYDNTGNLKETISDGLGGLTTGCAFDSGLNLYTTNFSNTKVVNFDAGSPHSVLQTIDTGATSPGGHSESVVFDGSGNFYVGHADGNRFVHKYDAAGVFQATFAPATENRGTDWIDLASDQKTLWYTSEGRKIKRFDVSGEGAQLPDFVDLRTLELSGTLYTLRLLPPGDSSSDLLVADSADIKRLNSAASVIQTYGATGENTWFALSLDPNGTSFWAAAFGTNNFYRFNIRTGAIELGPINTGTGTNLFGLCVNGGYSAAQDAPNVQTLNFTPQNNTQTSTNPGNTLQITLNNLQVNVNLTVRYKEVPSFAGVSETGLPCELNSPAGTKCVVYTVAADQPNSVFGSVSLYWDWTFKSTTPINPRFIKNGVQDITTFVVLDPGVGGDTNGFSTFTANEAPTLTGATACGFQMPVHEGAVLNAPRTVPLKFRGTTGNCAAGPFLTTLTPRLSVAKIGSGAPVPQTVQAAGNSNTSNFFRLVGDTWIFNWSTKNLSSGKYLLSVFDESNQIPAFSLRMSLR